MIYTCPFVVCAQTYHNQADLDDHVLVFHSKDNKSDLTHSVSEPDIAPPN